MKCNGYRPRLALLEQHVILCRHMLWSFSVYAQVLSMAMTSLLLFGLCVFFQSCWYCTVNRPLQTRSFS